MTGLLLQGDDAQPLARLPLGGTDGQSERWLQELLFAHPELLPIGQIDPGVGVMVPLARELALPRPEGTVFLDILGVTPQGRPVLVECKLWRNPQARRYVVGQILEYAALLRRWSYADLTARLRATLRGGDENPIFAAVRRAVPDLPEASFVDAVSRALLHGDFILAIVGDGIRSDLAAVADMIRTSQAGLSRLALVEVQLWSDAVGRIIVLPSLAMRTEVIPHRVVTDTAGMPLRSMDEDVESTSEALERQADPDAEARRAADRAFWQRFIDTVRFDHPDQPAPRHGGRNWVKIPLPGPAGWLTAYRLGNSTVGLFVTFRGEDGRAAWEQLTSEIDNLRSETDLPLHIDRREGEPFEGSIGVARQGDCVTAAGKEAALDWLRPAANALVNALRPRLAAMSRDAGLQR